MKNTRIKFIQKIYYILKCASEGWVISYIGGDKYEFTYPKIN